MYELYCIMLPLCNELASRINIKQLLNVIEKDIESSKAVQWYEGCNYVRF